jgi:hypothetical protein
MLNSFPSNKETKASEERSRVSMIGQRHYQHLQSAAASAAARAEDVDTVAADLNIRISDS